MMTADRGRHADATRPHDPDPRSRHRRNLRGPPPSRAHRAAATAPVSGPESWEREVAPRGDTVDRGAVRYFSAP